MIWLIPTVYAIGWVVTAIIAARHWFRRFGVELSGAVWAMFLAVMWPIVSIAYAIKVVAGRGL